MICRIVECKNCTCGRHDNRIYQDDRSYQAIPANGNFAPSERPKKLVRRAPYSAAIRNQKRFKETLDLLS
jgi:hypothetical protein